MRMGKYVPAALLAASITLSADLAAAQGPAAQKPPPAVDASAMEFFGVTRFFGQSASLGDAWEQAVHAVIDRMRTFLDAERAVALAAATPPKKRVSLLAPPAPPPPEVGSARVFDVHPVKVEPVTQSGVDARGQSAILLGGSATLPWTIP